MAVRPQPRKPRELTLAELRAYDTPECRCPGSAHLMPTELMIMIENAHARRRGLPEPWPGPEASHAEAYERKVRRDHYADLVYLATLSATAREREMDRRQAEYHRALADTEARNARTFAELTDVTPRAALRSV